MYLVTLALVISSVSRVTCNQRLDSLEVIPIEKAPYAVIVLCNNNKHFCSGTILHAEWVLTSAHCLYNMNGVFTEHDNSVTIIAGTNGLNDVVEEVKSGKAQARRSQRVLVYKSYSWLENFIGDLALIKLSEALNMTQRVSVAPLAGSRVIAQHDKHQGPLENVEFQCTAFGFGRAMRLADSEIDYKLKLQRYQVAKHCHCLEKIRSARSPVNIVKRKNTFVCDEVASFTGLCAGDNGGQLMCDQRLRGVATVLFHYEDEPACRPWKDRQNECGDWQSLSVFTDLCFYSSWLSKVVPGYPLTDENCSAINVSTNPFLVHYDYEI